MACYFLLTKRITQRALCLRTAQGKLWTTHFPQWAARVPRPKSNSHVHGEPPCELASLPEGARPPVALQRPLTQQLLPGLPGLRLPVPSWPWHSPCWPAWPLTAAAAAANSFMFLWLPRLPSRAVTNHSFRKTC